MIDKVWTVNIEIDLSNFMFDWIGVRWLFEENENDVKL